MEGVSSGVRDATEIDGKHGWRVAADACYIARQQRLHHQPLNCADEQDDGRVHIQFSMQLASRLTGFEQSTQPLTILTGQGLHHLLGQGLPRPR